MVGMICNAASLLWQYMLPQQRFEQSQFYSKTCWRVSVVTGQLANPAWPWWSAQSCIMLTSSHSHCWQLLTVIAGSPKLHRADVDICWQSVFSISCTSSSIGWLMTMAAPRQRWQHVCVPGKGQLPSCEGHIVVLPLAMLPLLLLLSSLLLLPLLQWCYWQHVCICVTSNCLRLRDGGHQDVPFYQRTPSSPAETLVRDTRLKSAECISLIFAEERSTLTWKWVCKNPFTVALYSPTTPIGDLPVIFQSTSRDVTAWEVPRAGEEEPSRWHHLESQDWERERASVQNWIILPFEKLTELKSWV